MDKLTSQKATTWKYQETGWVVINENHPTGAPPYAVPSTFASRRKDAIKKFCEDSVQPWEYWYRKYNFRCVKAESTIKINPMKV